MGFYNFSLREEEKKIEAEGGDHILFYEGLREFSLVRLRHESKDGERYTKNEYFEYYRKSRRCLCRLSIDPLVVTLSGGPFNI